LLLLLLLVLLLLHQGHLSLLHLLHLSWVESVLVDSAGQVVGAEKNVDVVGVEHLLQVLR